MEESVQFGIQATHRIVLLGTSLILLGLVLECVRRNLLKERYALLWLATSGVGLFVGIFPGIIVAMAELMHFQYLTVLFSLSFVFTLGLILSFSIVISRLSERNKQLTQEFALLAFHVKKLQQNNS